MATATPCKPFPSRNDWSVWWRMEWWERGGGRDKVTCLLAALLRSALPCPGKIKFQKWWKRETANAKIWTNRKNKKHSAHCTSKGTKMSRGDGKGHSLRTREFILMPTKQNKTRQKRPKHSLKPSLYKAWRCCATVSPYKDTVLYALSLSLSLTEPRALGYVKISHRLLPGQHVPGYQQTRLIISLFLSLLPADRHQLWASEEPSRGPTGV